MLEVRASAEERDLHIGDFRTGQHAFVPFFRQVSQNQALPVALQLIHMAFGGKRQPAAPRPGFEAQVYFGIVAQGFIVPGPLHSARDGFAIENGSILF